jgi:GNAT superfamily N-acetyltransferase
VPEVLGASVKFDYENIFPCKFQSGALQRTRVNPRPDSCLSADPSVVSAWVRGWALTRETPLPVPEGDGFRIDVGWPQQHIRYVFPSCSVRLRQLSESITDPWILLKACVPPDTMQLWLSSRWEVQTFGYMMTLGESTDVAESKLPSGYIFETVLDDPVSILRVYTKAAQMAAIGRLALVGDLAIYDRIETHPGHRRLGIASAVVSALWRIARERGVRRGALVATADGRSLYQSLGWLLHSLFTTAAMPGPPRFDARERSIA